jgi:glutamate-1-semialdehyde 2,1-aminomutase
MPGGNTRDSLFYSPYPVYIEKGEGCRVTDIDGTRYLDFQNNYTSLVLGHAPQSIVDAATKAVSSGSAPGGPTPVEVRWADHLCERVPAIERIRFTNSGTEATMQAIRTARAYTGNDLIAKFEGTYHGTHDDALMSVHPPTTLAGPPTEPRSVPASAGIPKRRQEDVLTLPFNDTEATLDRLVDNRDELAGVIIAPLMGSQVIPGDEAFIKAVREFTARHDIPLILDEVISFRLAYGGAQSVYDIEPDLVTFGKLIGGGHPVGAFGGREDMMDPYDPRGGADIVHSGTFNANPVTAAAGLRTLEKFDRSAIGQINSLTKSLVKEARDVVDDHEIGIQITHSGSLFNIYFSDDPVKSYREAARSPKALERMLFLTLLNEGIRLAPKLMGSLSTPIDEDECEEFVDAFDTAIERLRPTLEAHAPYLIQ